MKVYVVLGYESPDYTTAWSVYGVYVKRKDAENKIIYSINCWHGKEDNKLMSIYCDNCEFE